MIDKIVHVTSRFMAPEPWSSTLRVSRPDWWTAAGVLHQPVCQTAGCIFQIGIIGQAGVYPFIRPWPVLYPICTVSPISALHPASDSPGAVVTPPVCKPAIFLHVSYSGSPLSVCFSPMTLFAAGHSRKLLCICTAAFWAKLYFAYSASAALADHIDLDLAG